MITESKINQIVYTIAVHYKPDKIILFGSYAQGTATENSDLDILIVKDSDLPRHRRGSEVRKYLYGSMIPIDILVYTNMEVEQSQNVKYTFINEVMKSGRVLYERKD